MTAIYLGDTPEERVKNFKRIAPVLKETGRKDIYNYLNEDDATLLSSLHRLKGVVFVAEDYVGRNGWCFYYDMTNPRHIVITADQFIMFSWDIVNY